jgi:Fe2+ or Zn2+ uptake regulation protein
MRLNRNYSNEMQGHPQTKQRQLLLRLIREAGAHIDAKELFKRATDEDKSISHATVYRSLRLFKKLGLIDEKRLGQAQCYYEIKHSPQHQHLVCRECGKLIDFDCPLGEIVERVKREYGFTVTKAEVYLEGYCSECGEKKGRMNNQRVKELEEKIAEIRRRLPPHSIPPAMLQELLDLEEELEKAKSSLSEVPKST